MRNHSARIHRPGGLAEIDKGALSDNHNPASPGCPISANAWALVCAIMEITADIEMEVCDG
jgi:hypothetical protein